ncbi:hypothetical protein PF010_g6530 [Phytophthora fragariae]|uniref:Transglutaminase elicitor n=1 Tax=Phytophthora fragariae TaxID=53985 RepID=A0A6G0LKY1_9STRA|nr:hypothetical protein PF010_g6530 [Phytophthora fragariae]
MVYSPRTYLISAVVATVALQMQQTTASSLYYTPFTVSDTTNEITDKFPAYGADVADQDCIIKVEVDPTLPNITTISSVPVTYPDLLANLTTAPADGRVGPTLCTPSDGKVGKPGLSDTKDCATGWEDTQATRKLQIKRQLEANANQDIAKLEAYFGTKMETTLKNLPTVGVHTPSPWAGPYWPTYQDSINVQWAQNQPSAAEKYAKAFGKNATAFMDAVSKKNGIDSQSRRKQCSSDNDCSTLTDGSSCSIRTAHGPELKALVSLVYDGAGVQTVFTGARFNGGTDTPDEYGRHSNNAYRDLNPAYFHIASANILGKLNSTFVADVTAGAEVWNQPVRGFKVYEQTNMTLEEAAQTFYALEKYPWNAAAKSIVYVKSRLSWIYETYTDGGLVSSGQIDKFTTGQYYYYLLELDAAGVIIGGEWVYGSDDDHPDFLWLPKAEPAANTVTSIGLSYADVSMLMKKSTACTA